MNIRFDVDPRLAARLPTNPLGSAMVAVLRQTFDALREAGALPEFAVPVTIVAGGDELAEDYDVDDDALGFHAVMSLPDHEDMVNVADSLLAVVNIDRGARELAELWNADDYQRDCDVAAWLVTLPHELAHVADWVRHAGPRTPDEVFEADGVEAIRRIMAAAHAEHGNAEDAAEAAGSAAIDQVANLIDMREVIALLDESVRLRASPVSARGAKDSRAAPPLPTQAEMA